METARIKITISDDAGEVFDVVTLEMLRIAFLDRRDSDVLGAPAVDRDGDQCSLIDVIHEAAAFAFTQEPEPRRDLEPAVPFNNPNPVHNDRRPDECGMFVAIRSGCWHVGYTTESGENVTQGFGISDITGMRMLFSMWNVRTVRTSSSLDFPFDGGALITAAEAHNELDRALAWS